MDPNGMPPSLPRSRHAVAAAAPRGDACWEHGVLSGHELLPCLIATLAHVQLETRGAKITGSLFLNPVIKATQNAAQAPSSRLLIGGGQPRSAP